MKKEIIKYPYNSRIGDETKIFLSDEICESFVNITYRITDKKKEIVISAAFIFGGLFGMPQEARAI